MSQIVRRDVVYHQTTVNIPLALKDRASSLGIRLNPLFIRALEEEIEKRDDMS